MDDFLQRIADEWRERAPELGTWVMERLVNRTDVWGRYLPEKCRDRPTFGSQQKKAITAPFRQERGKVFLQVSSLEKHFKAKDGGGVLGLHSASSDGASQWLAIDIDLHEDDDLSVTREGNFVAAKAWYEGLQELGFDPLLMDSNGHGGFHILVLFEKPMETKSVRRFCERLVSDFSRKGLDQAPDIFPGTTGPNHYGSWLRIPGRHHTRDHFTRVWNDEPWGEHQWLEGHEAIDRLLAMMPAPVSLLETQGVVARRRTICLDFDGVVHSYVSGWHGETVIPDPPIHRVDQAIARLRRDFRVVIYSARCRNQAGVRAIEDWLARNEIEVDDVCRDKPPAHVYVDDRAVRFGGDWDETIASIYDFRK